MKRTLIFFVFLFMLHCSVLSQNYSIKNRLNTKLSLSFNRTNEYNDAIRHWDDRGRHPLKARLNARAECNYGVLNWLELGGYLGYVRYSTGVSSKFAPDFGVNVNVHLLPFFVENKDNRWELYFTAKYGGAYIDYGWPVILDAIILKALDQWHFDTTYFHAEDSEIRYRQVFGVGIGGGVYFGKKRQICGLYAEALVGQFSYFPTMTTCYYTVRVGIEFKFYAKNKKTENKEDDGILYH